MSKKINFKTGQKIFYIDETYGRINGEIVDKTSVSIFIKWEDIKEIVEQPISEASDIRLSH